MKHLWITAALLIWLQSGKALDVSVTYALFNASDEPYIELYFYMVGSTAAYLNLDRQNEQAAVSFTLWFQQADTIVKYDKFVLHSPIHTDTAAAYKDFMHLKRYALPEGIYDFHVAFHDAYSLDTTTTEFSQQLKVHFPKNEVCQSDIELLQALKKTSNEKGVFNKNGWYMEPLAFHYYHRKSDRLIFYNEIYHTRSILNDAFAVRYTLDWVLNEDRKRNMITGHRKLQAASVVPLLVQEDISHLPSGNYELTVEVRNRNMELLSSKQVTFQRSNPLLQVAKKGADPKIVAEEFVASLSEEELEYSLLAMTPILSGTDIPALKSVQESEDLDMKRYFIFLYWAARNPINPEEYYNQYMEVVETVSNQFEDGFRHGFETDRGYTFLKYGQPNDVVHVENDPSAPPYEIWIYYDFPKTQQNNVKFLFYNPSITNNQFELLHSTARGELNNPNWQRDLYQRSNSPLRGPNPIDATQVEDNWMRHADQYFTDF